MHYGIGDLFRKMLKEKALKGFYLAAMFAVTIAIAMTITGCGQAAEENGEEDTLSPVEQEENGQSDDGDVLVEVENAENLQEEQPEKEEGIAVEFPFEESEEYTLTFASQEADEKQGEFRLYYKDGIVLQQISYGAYEKPFYYILYREGERDLVFFPDEEREEGRFFEWNNGRFTEREMDVKLDWDLFLTEETERQVTKEIYERKMDEKKAERIRSFTLQKDTGKLQIWDDIIGEYVFEEEIELDKDGNPVNQDYYDFLFQDAAYGWSDDYDPKVHMDLAYENEEWREMYCESKEVFLAEYGAKNSIPKYLSFDRYGNPLVELYEDESGGFCGIIYHSYYVNSEKEKWAYMCGFTISRDAAEKWSDNTYSRMYEIVSDDEEGYEETIEYSTDGKPVHFESRGLAEVKDGSEIVEELIPLVKVDYIYRDDGTLFYRKYWHTTYLYMTKDHILRSYYDEKERVVFEDGYITSGDQEYYYIYEGDSDVPICKLDVYFSCHGGIAVYPTWYY